MATFIGLTVVATLVGYQVKGDWFEKNATTITACVLIAIGMIASIGFSHSLRKDLPDETHKEDGGMQ